MDVTDFISDEYTISTEDWIEDLTKKGALGELKAQISNTVDLICNAATRLRARADDHDSVKECSKAIVMYLEIIDSLSNAMSRLER